MSTPSRIHEVERYLALLGAGAPAGALLDLRLRRAGGRQMRQSFWPVGSQRLVATILRRASAGDVYIGVAPRARRSGGRDALYPCALVWADCDSEESVCALGELPVPTMLVASGSGANRHAYWSLRAALACEALALANRRLALALGADQGAVTNPAAILRVPGTLNWKRVPPAPVRLLTYEPTHRYEQATLLGNLPALPAPPSHTPRTHRGLASDPLLAVSPHEYVRLLTGQSVGRSGKVRCPLHADVHPSLHAWPDAARGWFCFGCNRGGSIYELAGAIWGIAPRGEGFYELRARLRALLDQRGAA